MASTRSRLRHKGRSESGTFTNIPHAVQDSDNWKRCSPTAIKLLMDMARRYNGRNNGDLAAAPKMMKPLGWRAATVTEALKELRHYGLVIQTRQGGLHRCSLYALSWLPIHDCRGKHDYSPTPVPPGDWKTPHEPYVRPARKKSPVRQA
jgi:hypothetical protein